MYVRICRAGFLDEEDDKIDTETPGPAPSMALWFEKRRDMHGSLESTMVGLLE